MAVMEERTMKIFIKTINLLMLSCFMILAVFSCAMMETKPQPYAGFTTKTMEGGGYKILVENMRRGSMIESMRIDKDTRIYDAVFFDITMSNVGTERISAFGNQFKLITNDSTVVNATSMFKGGFSGDFSEHKSNVIYPGTKKTGTIAFALKKTSDPIKLICDSYVKLETVLP